jgi:hypothetical protein
MSEVGFFFKGFITINSNTMEFVSLKKKSNLSCLHLSICIEDDNM